MERKITDLSVIELKAYAYDLASQINFFNQQLRAIEQELVNRNKEEQEKLKEES